MYAELSVFSLAAIIILAMLIGFWAGLNGRKRDTEEKEDSSGNPADNKISNKREKKSEKTAESAGEEQAEGWAIGSPAAGRVRAFREDMRRGIVIHPNKGALYSPVSGKIIRLYPTGNAFRLRTEFGVELFLQAGRDTDALEGMYFRPRVVQNEIVEKGKLLLEFDKDGISGEGYDIDILVSVEDVNAYHNVTLTRKEWLKNGENCMWISRN